MALYLEFRAHADEGPPPSATIDDWLAQPQPIGSSLTGYLSCQAWEGSQHNVEPQQQAREGTQGNFEPTQLGLEVPQQLLQPLQLEELQIQKKVVVDPPINPPSPNQNDATSAIGNAPSRDSSFQELDKPFGILHKPKGLRVRGSKSVRWRDHEMSRSCCVRNALEDIVDDSGPMRKKMEARRKSAQRRRQTPKGGQPPRQESRDDPIMSFREQKFERRMNQSRGQRYVSPLRRNNDLRVDIPPTPTEAAPPRKRPPRSTEHYAEIVWKSRGETEDSRPSRKVPDRRTRLRRNWSRRSSSKKEESSQVGKGHEILEMQSFQSEDSSRNMSSQNRIEI